MLAPLPESVRQAWGEVVSRDFTIWLEVTLSDWIDQRDERRKVHSRLTMIEAHQAEFRSELRELRREVKGHVDRQGARLDERIDRLSARIDARIDRL
jgi:hypothetical protein